MKRVWMNHWFSTALNIIDLMRQDYADLCIIGSNENQYSVVEYYLEFCKEYNIHFCLPRREMLKISECKE